MSSSTTTSESRAGSNKLVYFFGALGGLLFGYDTGSSPARSCSSLTS